jgi:hypothetical protein
MTVRVLEILCMPFLLFLSPCYEQSVCLVVLAAVPVSDWMSLVVVLNVKRWRQNKRALELKVQVLTQLELSHIHPTKLILGLRFLPSSTLTYSHTHTYAHTKQGAAQYRNRNDVDPRCKNADSTREITDIKELQQHRTLNQH